MTKAEFTAWQAETERSRGQWIVDSIHNGQPRVGEKPEDCHALVYRGGVNGWCLWVWASGRVEIGRYEGAIPHIGEASFRVLHTFTCYRDWNDAVTRFFRGMGHSGLLPLK